MQSLPPPETSMVGPPFLSSEAESRLSHGPGDAPTRARNTACRDHVTRCRSRPASLTGHAWRLVSEKPFQIACHLCLKLRRSQQGYGKIINFLPVRGPDGGSAIRGGLGPRSTTIHRSLPIDSTITLHTLRSQTTLQISWHDSGPIFLFDRTLSMTTLLIRHEQLSSITHTIHSQEPLGTAPFITITTAVRAAAIPC